MVLPIGDKARQQVGAAQQRAVRRGRATECDVVATAGTGVAAIEHEFFCPEPRLARFVVECVDDGNKFSPRRGRMDVDLDDAGIRRNVEELHSRIARRRVAFDGDRHTDQTRCLFDCSEQRGIAFEPLQRRHEHVEVAIAHLHGERGLDHFAWLTAAAAPPRARGKRGMLRQRIPRRKRIDRILRFGQYVGQRAEGQTKTEW